MTDGVVDARRKPIGLDLHRGELRAQRRERFAERGGAHVLEFGRAEMADRRRDDGAAEPERHGGLSEIEHWKNGVEHRRKAAAVFREPHLGRHDTAVEEHRRRCIAAQSESVPCARHGQPVTSRQHEIERRIGRAGTCRRQCRGDVALGVPGARHERLARTKPYAAPIQTLGARYRCPEVAARSRLAERERRQMRAARHRLQHVLERRGPRSGGHTRRRDRVHEEHHGNGRIHLRERSDHVGDCARPQRCAADVRGQQQAEQSRAAQRLHGVGRKPRLFVVVGGGGREHILGNATGGARGGLRIHVHSPVASDRHTIDARGLDKRK